MHWTSWNHCSNDTSVFPGVALPLKVLILGVPKWRPDVKVLIRHPMSALGWAGVWGQGDGPWGTHPPSGHMGAGDGDGCLGQTHPPSPGKVTSWSSPLGSLLPAGFTQGFGWGLLEGAFNSWSATSPQRFSKSWFNLWSVRSPSSTWRQCRVPHPGGGYQ